MADLVFRSTTRGGRDFLLLTMEWLMVEKTDTISKLMVL